MRRQSINASLAQSVDALVSNTRCSPFESEAMYHCVTCPRGATGRHGELKPRFLRVRIAPGTPAVHRTTQTVSPSWWNGRHTCLRNRRAGIPSSNLGEGTIHRSRLAQRESGCLTSSGSAVQSCHRLPVPARWPRGSRQLPAKQSNRWFESSSRVHPFISLPS